MTAVRLDTAMIADLKDILEDEFEELIETYIQDTQRKLVMLSEYQRLRQADEIRKITHSLKGASVNLGLNHLGTLCFQVESRVLSEGSSALSNEIDAISAEAQWACEELNRQI